MRLSIIALLLMSAGIANAGVVTLNGSNLTQDEAWAIAEGKDTVAIAPEAMDRLKKAHELVLLAAKGGTPVYGLTVGVGLNKGKGKIVCPAGVACDEQGMQSQKRQKTTKPLSLPSAP